MATHQARDHRAIALFDRVYRAWHRLDDPPAKVPPLLTLRRARAWRIHRLADGTVVQPGDPYGQLHLDNAQVIALHDLGLSAIQLGLVFRRHLQSSLGALAGLTDGGGRFRDLVAFSAVTIFHRGLQRLGFEVEPSSLLAPRLTGAYQHALLSHLSGRPVAAHRAPRAERLWISRRRLRDLYGPLPRAS